MNMLNYVWCTPVEKCENPWSKGTWEKVIALLISWDVCYAILRGKYRYIQC
jgi:hypothetical protein